MGLATSALEKVIASLLVHPGALTAASGWHATSAQEADNIRALGFQQPICVAPNGIAAPTATEVAAARSFWREQCPAAFQRPTALFYARFHAKKRVFELIDLWLERAPRDWLLLVVGLPEAYSVADLSAYVQRSRGSERVNVFDGTGVPAPYVAAQIYLLPSHSENFGLTIAEALAHGLPAVVTNTTPWDRLNQNGSGWCTSWEEFGHALGRALSESPARLAERGAVARQWVLAEFSWAAAARGVADFYHQLSSPR